MIAFIISYTITFFLCLCIFTYILTTRRFNYWKLKKVPYIKPLPLFGNYAEYILLKKFIGSVTQGICQKFPKEPCIGAFYGTEPALIVQDPDLLKLVMTKDFYYFSGRENTDYNHSEVITQNLFFASGNEWKVVRQNLTPLFSTAKMRNMFHLIQKCGHQFESLLEDEIGTNELELDVKTLMTRYTIDCIGSCAFGVNTNAMAKKCNENNIFRTMADKIFEVSNERGLKTAGRAIWPAIFYGLGFQLFPSEIDNFFRKLLGEIFVERKYKPSTRNDFVDLVLDWKKHNYITGDSLSNMKVGEGSKVKLEADDDLLMAQCIVFYAAGFETSSTTLSFTLYEMAKNEKVQRKAQKEIEEYLLRHKGKVEYDTLGELNYLNACIDEALRLYPVLSVLTREVVESYTMPNGVVLDKGMRVHIPVYHLHLNPDYFPEPKTYRPERFLPEQRNNIKPYTYMPFGEGPRICIGMRFARMQMLAGLVVLLKKYSLELGANTARHIEFEPRALVTQPFGRIDLKFVARS